MFFRPLSCVARIWLRFFICTQVVPWNEMETQSFYHTSILIRIHVNAIYLKWSFKCKFISCLCIFIGWLGVPCIWISNCDLHSVEEPLRTIGCVLKVPSNSLSLFIHFSLPLTLTVSNNHEFFQKFNPCESVVQHWLECESLCSRGCVQPSKLCGCTGWGRQRNNPKPVLCNIHRSGSLYPRFCCRNARFLQKAAKYHDGIV